VKNILERISTQPLIFDGAMGTMIYSKGVFINTCYEHLCITNPVLISEIHQEYALEEINRASVRLAREAAGDEALVAGSVGPILKAGQVFIENETDKLAGTYREQMAVLADEGIDFFMLETFSHIQEAQLAATVAKTFGLPVFVSMTVGVGGETQKGRKIEQLVQTLESDSNVDGIGVNCGVGPAAAFSNAERALSLTTKPFTPSTPRT